MTPWCDAVVAYNLLATDHYTIVPGSLVSMAECAATPCLKSVYASLPSVGRHPFCGHRHVVHACLCSVIHQATLRICRKATQDRNDTLVGGHRLEGHLLASAWYLWTIGYCQLTSAWLL